MALLADVVAVSSLVAETSSRSRKIAILAELLQRLDADEVAIATGFLSGVPRQGRVGIGYSAIHGVEVEAAGEPSLEVIDLDRAITDVQNTSGKGSAAARGQVLRELLRRATGG